MLPGNRPADSQSRRIGGGDQIYNDGIRVSGPLRPWTDIANPKKRRHHPFPESLRLKCDDYYLKNYIRWCVDLLSRSRAVVL